MFISENFGFKTENFDFKVFFSCLRFQNCTFHKFKNSIVIVLITRNMYVWHAVVVH